MNRIGFMQGRLSPKPEGRIQAFPKDHWREEFAHAKRIGFDCIEFIHDELHIEQNPLETAAGRNEVRALAKSSGVAVGSICGDWFMVHPIQKNVDKAKWLLGVAKEVDCPLVEFPFVDSSSLVRQKNDLDLLEALRKIAREGERLGVQISVESDLPPVDFRDYLRQLPPSIGVNLDLGNSAALGYDVLSECAAYGERIYNVHIKDRVIGGTTVPLLTGNTDFPRAFRALKACGYKRDLVLQTCPDPDYLGIAAQYRQMTAEWAKELWT